MIITSELPTKIYKKFTDFYIHDVQKRNILNNISIFTVNFNNMYATCNMLYSFYNNINYNIPIYIIDNSTILEKNISIIYDNFNIIDNRNFKLLPNLNDISKNHSLTIDYALYNVIQTDYVILCDYDIIFKKNINDILNNFNEYDIIGTIEDGYVPPLRLTPVFCILNVKKIKENNIRYFDNNKCKVPITPFKKRTFIYDKYYDIDTVFYYDTGSSFLEEILRRQWSLKNIVPDLYYEHFDGLGHIETLLKDTSYIKRKYINYNDFISKNKHHIYNM